MSAHLERAEMLISQTRFEMAEQELHQALAADPDNSMAHAFLAICMCERKKYQDATDEAQQAVHLDPDSSLAYYVLALIYFRRNRFDEAELILQRSLEIDPHNPESYALYSNICLARRRWKIALQAAELGLRVDPDHVECTNLRAMALVRLGHKDIAGETIAAALARAPENSDTHANQGWTLIEQGDYPKAMEHFREALRLDPESEWARRGILEAMKARFLIYRWVLVFFLWTMKLTRKGQWGFLIGAFVGYQILLRIAQNNPDWAPWLMPLIIAYVAFALMTWLAQPLFDLTLLLNSFGRMALSRPEKLTAFGVGICVAISLSFVASYFATNNFEFLGGAIAFVMIVPPLGVIHRCDEGFPRVGAILITVMVAVVATFFSIPPTAIESLPDLPKVFVILAVGLSYRIFPFVAIGSQIGANIFVQMDARK